MRAMRVIAGLSTLIAALTVLPAGAAMAQPGVDPNGYVPYSISVGDGPKGIGTGGNVGLTADSSAGTASVFTACQPKSCLPGSVSPLAVGSSPSAVAVSNGTAYVTNTASGTVSVIDVSSGYAYNVVGTITVGGQPTGVAVSPDGTWVYVADNASNLLDVIDSRSRDVITQIPVPDGPWGVAVSPDGTRIYVVANRANVVTVLQAGTYATVGSIPVGSAPGMIALDASGSTGYVANNGSGTVSVLALSGSDLTPGSLAATIPVGSQPWGVAATGSAVFVANNGSGTVSVIDPSSRSVVATVATGTGPFAIARAFDSVYVTNTGSSTVSTIALAADRVNVTWSKVRRTRTVIGVTPRSPAVEYSIVARKSGKVRRGTCTVPSSGSSVRCRVKVGSGLWRVSVQTRLPWQPVAMGAQNKRFSF